MKKLIYLNKYEYLLIVIPIVIAIVFITISLSKIKKDRISSINSSLITINNSSHEALSQWLNFRKENISDLSKNPYLIEKTHELLAITRDSASLVKSEKTSELRSFFQPILAANEDLGVFLIAPDYTSVFSMRDQNTGTINLMANQSKEALDRVLKQGQTVLIPPIVSDVQLKSKYSKNQNHTMFLVTPIYTEGEIIAAFSLRLDTKKDFSRIVELGVLNQTGETLGFDSNGEIVTKYDQDERITQTIQNNLFELSQSKLSDDQPFSDLFEYIDYKGDNCFAVLSWDKDLNIGILSKINVKEALSEYHFLRNLMIFAFIALVLIGFFVTNTIINLRQKTEFLLIKQNEKLEEMVAEKTAELQHNIKTKDKFFSILAHDLRSPFSGLLGLFDMLLSHPDDFTEKDKTEMMQQVYNSSSQLFKLLENLLAWASTQTNSITLYPELISVSELIQSNFDLSAQHAQSKNITLVNNVPENMKVFADKNTVDTVFRNLISNAIKFTHPNGEVKIEASTNKEFLLINVQDNGVGIPEEIIDKLFKIEEKTSTLGTNEELGSGLGLVLCKEFIELNYGKISVESQVNVGTRFIVELPYD